MPRNNSQLETILERIVDQLRSYIDDANESTCYISMDLDSISAPNTGDFVYVVTPSPSFGITLANFVGGMKEQTEVRWIIAVTVFSFAQNDEPGRDEHFLTNSQRGLLPRMTRVARALYGHDLTDADGNYILNEPIHPSDGHVEHQSRNQGSVQLGLEVCFDWKLTD